MTQKIRPATPQDGCAWITGASSGIGAELARILVREGWQVVLSARSAEKLQALAAELGEHAIPLPLDVSDAEAVKAAIEKIESDYLPIALAVLNAGIYIPDRGRGFKAEILDQHMRINLLGVAHGLEHLLPAMTTRGHGQIAITASIAGYRGLPLGASYAASKAALISLTESLKFDCDRAGIKLQLVTPGFIETPLTAQNRHPMPNIISAKEAAFCLHKGLSRRRFEISFPRWLPFLLLRLRCLPYALYFPLVRGGTGKL